MSCGVFVSVDGGRMYDQRASWCFERHSHAFRADGRGRVFYTGGLEAREFMEMPPLVGSLGVPAVVDDFGNLVRVS